MIGPRPTGHGLLGSPVEELAPLRLPDLSRHAASVRFPPQHLPDAQPAGGADPVAGRVYGRLYLTEMTTGQAFTEDDEVIVRALAAAAGAAVDNGRLYEQGQRQRRWLEATGEVTTALLAGSDAKHTLLLIAAAPGN